MVAQQQQNLPQAAILNPPPGAIVRSPLGGAASGLSPSPRRLPCRAQAAPRHMRMLRNPRQLPRDAFRRQHKVHTSRRHRVARHGIIFGRPILRKRDAPLRFDRLQPQRPIRSRARENHPDRPLLLLLGQRLQERVNRTLRPGRLLARLQPQLPPLQRSAACGGMTYTWLGWTGTLSVTSRTGIARGAGQNLRQCALMVRVQMLHQHKGHARIHRQMLQQLRKGLQPARRRANAHDGQRSLQNSAWRDRAFFSPGIRFCATLLFMLTHLLLQKSAPSRSPGLSPRAFPRTPPSQPSVT